MPRRKPWTDNVQLWEADLSLFQAREMRLVLLDVLEARKELFCGLREPPVGVQLCHELELPRHVGGTLADMAANHLQIGFFLRHVLSRRILGSRSTQGNSSRGSSPALASRN